MLLKSDIPYHEQQVVNMAVLSCAIDLCNYIIPGFDWQDGNVTPRYYWDDKNKAVVYTAEFMKGMQKLHRLSNQELLDITSVPESFTRIPTSVVSGHGIRKPMQTN